MTPPQLFPAEGPKPAGSDLEDAPRQPKQARRERRGAPMHPKSAAQPRPEDKSALVLWAFSEYQRLCEQGQPPDPQEWCERFPTCRSALRQVLDMEAHVGSFLDRRLPGSDDEGIDWPSVGSRRAGFTILRELARGGLARVYLATETATGGRLVVLKCSWRGEVEARTLGRLNHPHVVPILSARRDRHSGLTMVCMPYLGCTTLEDSLEHLSAAVTPLPSKASFFLDVLRFRAQPEDPPQPALDPCLLHGSYTDGVVHLAAQLAETLAFLHDNGVCHRDLKPSNVLLDPSGKPLLLDFNLSDSERETAVPLGGTLRYMAPEQIRAFMDRRKDGMDERADCYALGVMVYELLGGAHPCAALLAQPFQPSQAQPMLAALKTGFRPFREICPELERPVAAVLDRSVALDASDRPGSAAELAAALKQQFAPARRLRRRLAAHRRWLAATLGLLLVAAAVLVSVWSVLPPFSEREYNRGRSAYVAGDFERAETHFDAALSVEPAEARFRYARGCARLQQSKYLPPDPARFEKILSDLTFTEQGAADVRTLAVHAYTQLRNQQYDEAIKKYNFIQRSDYRPVMVLNNRGFCYMAKSQWAKAQSDLEKAFQLDPHCQAVRYNRAMIAMQMRLQGKTSTIPPTALDDIEQALQGGLRTSALSCDAALLYAQAANEDPGHPHFERALFHLRQAIAAGQPAAKFQPSPALRETLQRPEFVALLGSLPAQAPAQAELRLLDPVELPD